MRRNSLDVRGQRWHTVTPFEDRVQCRMEACQNGEFVQKAGEDPGP